MSEIPRDIWQKAHDIMDDACLPGSLVTNGTDRAIRDSIARAILAERKRCAEVAEARAEWVPLRAGDMRAAIEAGQ